MAFRTLSLSRILRANLPALTVAALLDVAVLGHAGAAVQSSARHFLWKVTDTAGRDVGHLMGSLHVLTAAYYPLAPVITEAFDQSTTLVEEIDLAELESPPTLALIMQRATFPGSTTIDTVVSSETVATIERRAAKAGLPAAALKRMKPWMVAVTLLGVELKKAGFDPDLGLDRHFFDKARAAGKAVSGLETAAYQIERFDGLPAKLQEEMLLETLNDIDRQQHNAKRLADSWANGDTAMLEAILLNDVRQSPEIYDRLLTERHRQWLPAIERCFASSPPCFVVVGAAHLVGPGGLVGMLGAKGYRVEQQ